LYRNAVEFCSSACRFLVRFTLTLKMETISFSWNSVNFNRITWHCAGTYSSIMRIQESVLL
jgi:hypothetical protein